MKDLKHQNRPGTGSPSRSVSLQIRDYQVTVKVRSALPQVKPSPVLRTHIR